MAHDLEDGLLRLELRMIQESKPVTHASRRGDLYYPHSGVSKTGKPTCHFSGKAAGSLVHEVPEGFEIYENPGGRVYLRRITKQVITDSERRIAESVVKAAGATDSIVEVNKDAITVFLGDPDRGHLPEAVRRREPLL